MYILDTNVISELRKARTRAVDPHVLAWSKRVDPQSLYLSAITLLELEIGIQLMERRDQRQGSRLRSWMTDQVILVFSGRILAVDREVAVRCATLHISNPRPFRDSLIAATALVHGMTVVTRDVSHFAPTGVSVLDPWQA
ncbi:MAG TPA: type II toxin-antitoxin system VapC family toxin [Terracidiphilus sp.]|jgi:predicted nucleic acid-binding protein|nr:type II toxin-antitoxin system VapC family toxin [Terracidiphilus sp.]